MKKRIRVSDRRGIYRDRRWWRAGPHRRIRVDDRSPWCPRRTDRAVFRVDLNRPIIMTMMTLRRVAEAMPSRRLEPKHGPEQKNNGGSRIDRGEL